MVVVKTPKPGKKSFFFVWHIITIFIGIDKQCGGAGNEHLVPDDRYAQGGYKIFILNKHFGGVANPVPIGVFQNHYPIPLFEIQMVFWVVIEIPIINSFRDPYPSLFINIHIGRVV